MERCQICGKDKPIAALVHCPAAGLHRQAAGRGGRCPACGHGHLTCVRFTGRSPAPRHGGAGAEETIRLRTTTGFQ